MNLLNKILPILILIIAVSFAIFFIKGKKSPLKSAPKEHVLTVEVAKAKRAISPVPLFVTGTVQAKYTVKLVPQVSGLITWIHPRFLRGEFFKKGQVLFKIDNTNYINALEEAKARLTKAQLELEKIKAKAEIAKKEWELQEHKDKEKPLPLVFYKPQYENAKQEVKAALSLVKRAEVDLSRTIITAPFDCYIKKKSVEIGHFVRSGTQVAELVYSKQAEVVFHIEEKYVPWLKAQNESDSNNGSTVEISIPGTGAKINGYIDRIAPFVNEKTRLTDVFVLIDDPFCITKKRGCQKVAIGTFVTGTIMATPIDNLILIPSSALKEDGKIYVVEKSKTLSVRKVDVVYLTHNKAWVLGPIKPEELVVISQISGPPEGIKVEIASFN